MVLSTDLIIYWRHKAWVSHIKVLYFIFYSTFYIKKITLVLIYCFYFFLEILPLNKFIRFFHLQELLGHTMFRVYTIRDWLYFHTKSRAFSRKSRIVAKTPFLRAIVIDLAQYLMSLWAVCQLQANLTHMLRIKRWWGQTIWITDSSVKQMCGFFSASRK